MLYFFPRIIGVRRVLSSAETTNGTNAVKRPAVPSEAGERGTRDTRERHRYILFPCDGVANPIKDVPTGGRPIRPSPAGGRRTGQPCAVRAGSLPSPKGNDPTWKAPEAQRGRQRRVAGAEGRWRTPAVLIIQSKP